MSPIELEIVMLRRARCQRLQSLASEMRSRGWVTTMKKIEAELCVEWDSQRNPKARSVHSLPGCNPAGWDAEIVCQSYANCSEPPGVAIQLRYIELRK